jgi:hypothetical protein
LTPGAIFFVEDFNQERPNNDNEMDLESRLRQAEIDKQQAELDSAIVSLKTNLCIILSLILLVLSMVFLTSDVVALLLSLLKNLVPVLTIFMNFKKIQSLPSAINQSD